MFVLNNSRSRGVETTLRLMFAMDARFILMWCGLRRHAANASIKAPEPNAVGFAPNKKRAWEVEWMSGCGRTGTSKLGGHGNLNAQRGASLVL